MSESMDRLEHTLVVSAWRNIAELAWVICYHASSVAKLAIAMVDPVGVNGRSRGRRDGWTRLVS